MILTITKCSNANELELGFYGNKEDFIQCICLLLKVAREEGII